MKLKGRLSNWNDQKGYGFVEPLSGGARAFVHIKSFSRRNGRRPTEGDLIVYQQVKDPSGRDAAVDIIFSVSAQPSSRKSSSKRNSINNPQGKSRKNKGWWGEIALTFLTAILGYTVFSGQLPYQVAVFYLLASLITFIAYAIDKSSAQAGRWRTQESTLHFFALIGGWPGAYLAQKNLRHKSIKQEFQSTFWITIFLNFALLLWLLSEQGNSLLKSIVY